MQDRLVEDVNHNGSFYDVTVTPIEEIRHVTVIWNNSSASNQVYISRSPDGQGPPHTNKFNNSREQDDQHHTELHPSTDNSVIGSVRVLSCDRVEFRDGTVWDVLATDNGLKITKEPTGGFCRIFPCFALSRRPGP